MFLCVKYFNVTTVGMVCSLTPLVVCILAYFILSERLRMFDMIALLTVFAAVMLVILGTSGEERKTMEVNTFALVCLICQPVLLASGAICMRMMRKMPETTASFYQNIALFVIAGVFMLFEGTSFLFMWHFSLVSWLTITLSALFTILT